MIFDERVGFVKVESNEFSSMLILIASVSLVLGDRNLIILNFYMQFKGYGFYFPKLKSLAFVFMCVRAFMFAYVYVYVSCVRVKTSNMRKRAVYEN